MMSYSRQQFFEIRRNFQTYGADGLIGRLTGPRGLHPNRVSAAIETTVLDHALAHPRRGPTGSHRNTSCAAYRSRGAGCAASGSAIGCSPTYSG